MVGPYLEGQRFGFGVRRVNNLSSFSTGIMHLGNLEWVVNTALAGLDVSPHPDIEHSQ